jgi:uncharacterized protein YbaA (DUF1428 family)
MGYVDGYVLVVPRRKLGEYRKMARWGERVWRKHGALDYRECVADDLESHCGTPFPELMDLKRGETVVFAYVVYRSRAHRDRVNAKVMQEMSKEGMPKEMPFDMTRMVCGGFKVIVGG